MSYSFHTLLLHTLVGRMFHNYVVLLIIWQNLYLQHLQLSLGVTGDVMTRDSQASAGYWEIVQDALGDLVRIMLMRCYDEVNHPVLYNACQDLRGQVWLCAFPNLFLTIAPAEWKFARPFSCSLTSTVSLQARI